ncbi:MAG: GNAT family N-acetyltransferase [Alphaproteobacteria bacterium]|nr:MAG: GNAT family N-acetyltransferase [Alphaproteobacteria bacterium]
MHLAPPSTVFEDIRVDFVSTTEGDHQRGFVPGYHFRILNSDGVNVGHVNFRVGDTQHVRLAAGHIGFGISEGHRGNRYAGKACLALAPWLATFNERVLITADPDNLASIRTIQRIGGVYLDEVDVPVDDPHYLRGSHRKARYLWNPSQVEQAEAGDHRSAGA